MPHIGVEQTGFDGVWRVWLPGFSVAVNDATMQTNLKMYDKDDDGILEPDDFSGLSEGAASLQVASHYLDVAREAGFECKGWRAEDITEMGWLNSKLASFVPKARDLISRTEVKCVEYCYLRATSSENWDHLTRLYGDHCNGFVELANYNLHAFSTWLKRNPLQMDTNESCVKIDLPYDIPEKFKEEIGSIIKLGAYITFHLPEKEIFSGELFDTGSERIEIPMKAARYFVYSADDTDDLEAYLPLDYYVGLTCDFE